MRIFSFLTNRQPKNEGDKSVHLADVPSILPEHTHAQVGRQAQSFIEQNTQDYPSNEFIENIASADLKELDMVPLDEIAAQSVAGEDRLSDDVYDPIPELGKVPTTDLIAILQNQAEPVLENAAILYAKNQEDLAEECLLAELKDASGDRALRSLYWALFDIYRQAGREANFEALAFSYARKLETSPPSWSKRWDEEYERAQNFPKILPVVILPAILDESISRQLESLDKLFQSNPVVRLNCSAVKSLNANACALLLHTLQIERTRSREVVLFDGGVLLSLVQKRIDSECEYETSWLLQLEILRLLGKEAEFESLSLDYCMRFEISPPSFFTSNMAGPRAKPGHFMMPLLIEENPVGLINAIMATAHHQDTVVLDCMRLKRIEFNAAEQLLYGITPLSEFGKSIRFENINHLSAELLNILGFAIISDIVPFRY